MHEGEKEANIYLSLHFYLSTERNGVVIFAYKNCIYMIDSTIRKAEQNRLCLLKALIEFMFARVS